MPISNYFDLPFAVDGTLTPVPDGVQSDGSVSYAQGYGVNYTLQPGTTGALNVGNAQMNQIFFDITSAIQYQQQGLPAPFITSVMNGGSPFSYAQYATVVLGGVAYQSNVSGNMDTPPSSKWNVISLSAPNQFVGGTSTGSANAQTIASVSPANGLSLAVNGQSLVFTAGFTNTGSTTLAVTAPSISATIIKKVSGSSLVNLTGGEIVATAPVYLTVDTAVPCWVLNSGPALGTIAPLNIGGNIVNNGTGTAVTSIPTSSLTGGSQTAALAQWGNMIQRSDSGTVMADTLPGTALASGWWVTWANEDASAILTIAAGSGAQLDGVAQGFAYISPGHKVTFLSDGTNYWTVTQQGRLRLKGPLNVYVNGGTGNDSNPGLTAAIPFATIQAAVNFVANKVDLNGLNVTINVADGTYTGNVSVSSPWVGNGTVTLSGNNTTPANCIISTTSADCIDAGNNAILSLQGFKLITTTAGNCLNAFNGGQIILTGNMNFGACAAAHMLTGVEGIIQLVNNYTISGGALEHLYCNNHGCIIYAGSQTITLTGTPAFTTFAFATENSLLTIGNNTFSGAATGTRYNANFNAVIQTNSGGATYLPGNASGVTSTGGQYG